MLQSMFSYEHILQDKISKSNLQDGFHITETASFHKSATIRQKSNSIPSLGCLGHESL